MIYLEMMNLRWQNFFEYCHGRNTEALDNLALYVKIALEFGGKYYYNGDIAICDIIEFDTPEDLTRFKLQFS